MEGLLKMKNKKFFIFVVIPVIVISIIISIRIIYINSKFNNITSLLNERDDITVYNDINLEISDYIIYTGEALNKNNNDDLEDIVDEYDILFDVTLNNYSNDTKKFNAVATGITYGENSGGNVNPYLFQYFNPDTKGIITLEPNESKTITLAFPYNEYNDSIIYIVSLYPEKIKIRLR